MKKEKVLISAILFSAVWHIFWLSAFTVVVVPNAKESVKFSSVSFLGPILEMGALNVGLKAHKRTDLEKNYLASIESSPSLTGEDIVRDDYVLPSLNTASPVIEEELTALTVAKIDTNKLEPGRDID